MRPGNAPIVSAKYVGFATNDTASPSRKRPTLLASRTRRR